MLLVCLIWGINFSVTKLAIAQIPPLPFTAIRFTTREPAALARAPGGRGAGAGCRRRAVRRLVVLGVVGNTCYQLAFILGLAHTTRDQQLADPRDRADRGRGLRRRCWASSGSRGACGRASRLGTLGVVLVIAASGIEFSASTLHGDLLTVLAVLCWAGYTVGPPDVAGGVSPLRVTTITTIAGHARAGARRPARALRLEWGAVRATAWVALAYATLLSLVVAYILWNRSVQTVGGTRTAIYMCVTPLVAGRRRLGHARRAARPLAGVGAVLIMAGVLLTRW